MKKLILLIFLGAAFVAARTQADPFSFTTGAPDGRMAAASRPDSTGKFEIESADDFILTSPINITSATFTGLLPTGLDLSTIGEVQVEIYRVFPNDSNVGRTSGPPTFSTIQVPTRVNSPSDVAFDSRNSLAAGGLSFTTTLLNASFTTLNSISPGGIHPSPGQTTGGNGAVTGQEVQFNVTFTTPFNLAADHYFFVPQVELPGATDNFLWLSAPGPPLFTGDLQAWTRDANLDPDWLREGTDIVGGNPAPKFNESFSLAGTVPDSASTALLLGSALGALFYLKQRTGRRRK
jgi:hypothetical protein